MGFREVSLVATKFRNWQTKLINLNLFRHRVQWQFGKLLSPTIQMYNANIFSRAKEGFLRIVMKSSKTNHISKEIQK